MGPIISELLHTGSSHFMNSSPVFPRYKENDLVTTNAYIYKENIKIEKIVNHVCFVNTYSKTYSYLRSTLMS